MCTWPPPSSTSGYTDTMLQSRMNTRLVLIFSWYTRYGLSKCLVWDRDTAQRDPALPASATRGCSASSALQTAASVPKVHLQH